MDFLLDEGFTKEFISELSNKYDEGIIDQFILDSYNVIEVINYMKEIGIKRIDELLLTHIGVFLKDIDRVKRSFNKHDINEIVKEINEDVFNIEKV